MGEKEKLLWKGMVEEASGLTFKFVSPAHRGLKDQKELRFCLITDINKLKQTQSSGRANRDLYSIRSRFSEPGNPNTHLHSVGDVIPANGGNGGVVLVRV